LLVDPARHQPKENMKFSHEEYTLLLTLLYLFISKENHCFEALCNDLNQLRAIYSPGDVGKRDFRPHGSIPEEMRPKKREDWKGVGEGIWGMCQRALAEEDRLAKPQPPEVPAATVM